MSLHSTCSNTVSSCDFQAIDSIHQVGVYCLALVPANTLPKTPLGGIHLSETKQLFLEGSLHPCNVLMCPHTCVTNLPKPRQKQPGMPRGWEGSCGVSGGPLQPWWWCHAHWASWTEAILGPGGVGLFSTSVFCRRVVEYRALLGCRSPQGGPGVQDIWSEGCPCPGPPSWGIRPPSVVASGTHRISSHGFLAHK